jgi:hypothetical protein
MQKVLFSCYLKDTTNILITEVGSKGIRQFIKAILTTFKAKKGVWVLHNINL